MNDVSQVRTPPATPEDLLRFLERLGIKTVTQSHAAVFTVAQSSAINRSIPGGHTKNLFVKDKKDNYFLIVAEGSALIEMNRIHGRIGARSRLSFASADRLMEFLGVEPGSVTAFGVINDRQRRVGVILDEPLLAHGQISCHPLTNTMTTTISRQDLLKFLDAVDHTPKILALSQAPDRMENRHDGK